MDFQKSDTAVVFIDPQNDVLSEKGANWGSVGASVTENNTVTHMEQIFRSAKDNGYQVFISLLLPDRQWLEACGTAGGRRVQNSLIRQAGAA